MSEHIRIGDVAPRTQYVADGVETVFPYPFPIFAIGDLEVRLDALVATAGYTVLGAGASEGGNVVFAAPPAAGIRVTLRRVLDVARTTDFQENGVLRANTLNDELDYQVAALQEAKEDISTTIRLAPSEVGDLQPLPGPTERANRLLGFDSVGEVTVFDRGEPTLTLPQPGAIPRTVEDKLAEHLSVRDFGAVGDGATDDGPALAAAMLAAAATGKVLEIGEGTFRTAQPLVLAASAGGLEMRGTILYDPLPNNANKPALTIGDATRRVQARRYAGIRVVRRTQSDWSDERVIGCLLRNFDACMVEVALVQGFTIGLRTEGGGIASSPAGFEDTSIKLGRLVNNRFGLDIYCSQPGPYAWNNSVRYFGGHFANAGSVNPTVSRYGVRLSRAAGAYALHNTHVFYGPAFELQNGYQAGGAGTAIDGIPFLNLTAGRAVIALQLRMEGCSRWVAEHRNAGLNSDTSARIDAQDCVYEVLYASNGAQPNIGGLPLGDSYLVDVKYGPGCNRAGGTVVRQAQAAAASRCTRLLAELRNLRAAAFVWRRPQTGDNEIGFEGAAVVSSNTAGTSLNALAFPGLTNFTPVGDAMSFPTSRGIGWVVRTDLCKEFEIAFDGNRCRPFVMIFDAAENVIPVTLVADPDGPRTTATGIPPLPPGIFDPDPYPGRPDSDPDPDPTEQPPGDQVPNPAGPVVLFSNAGYLYNTLAKWWVTGAEPQDFSVSRLQRVTLPAEAKFAILGVASLGTEFADADLDGISGETNVLRSMRLFCPPEYAPAVLFGGARSWGTRELTATAAFDPPSLAPGTAVSGATPGGATPTAFSIRTALTVPMPGVFQGDFIDAAWLPSSGFHTGGYLLHGAVGAPSELGGSGSASLVTVIAQNLTGGTVDAPAGTVVVRAIKSRL